MRSESKNIGGPRQGIGGSQVGSQPSTGSYSSSLLPILAIKSLLEKSILACTVVRFRWQLCGDSSSLV